MQTGLFDERNLLEISSPDFPVDRLVACRNPKLTKLRAHTRDSLLAATVEEIKVRVAAGKQVGQDKIGVAVGKVAKHFDLLISDDSVTFSRKTDSFAAQAALDGLYIIRTPFKA